MFRVPAPEFRRDAARYDDLALTRPVTVTRDGRAATVLISAEEYERLKRRDREVLGLEDFDEADLVALEASRPPEESRAFDGEVTS